MERLSDFVCEQCGREDCHCLEDAIELECALQMAIGNTLVLLTCSRANFEKCVRNCLVSCLRLKVIHVHIAANECSVLFSHEMRANTFRTYLTRRLSSYFTDCSQRRRSRLYVTRVITRITDQRLTSFIRHVYAARRTLHMLRTNC